MLGFHTFINRFKVVNVFCAWFQKTISELCLWESKHGQRKRRSQPARAEWRSPNHSGGPATLTLGKHGCRLGNGPIFCWATLPFPKSSIVVTSGRVVNAAYMLMACACVITKTVEKLFAYLRIYHS